MLIRPDHVEKKHSKMLVCLTIRDVYVGKVLPSKKRFGIAFFFISQSLKIDSILGVAH